jgi:hypothetical protein
MQSNAVVHLADRQAAERRKERQRELARERARRHRELRAAEMKIWHVPAHEDLAAALAARGMVRLEDCETEEDLLEAIGEAIERMAGIS